MEESLEKIYKLLYCKIMSYLVKNSFLTWKIEILQLSVKVKKVRLSLSKKSNLYRN